MQLIEELKRRNVFKVGAAYLALAWIVTQITGTIVPALNLPSALNAIVVWIGLIGFPFVLVFAWAYELTPEGLKRESEIDRSASITPDTGKRLDRAIVALLVVAIALFALDRFIPRRIAEPATAAAGSGVAQPPAIASPAAAPPAPAEPAQHTPGERSIAVLPFVDMSAAKDQEYMGDGIAEELLNLLTKIPEMQVTSRSSAFSFKGKEMKLEQVARELRVAHILEGSVRAAGNRVRITAQLIDTRSDTHLWSETYDRTLDDIFAVQDEIARSVVQQLRIKLLGEAPKTTATDPRAYALFLQGRQAGYQTTAESLTQAVELYKKAWTSTRTTRRPGWGSQRSTRVRRTTGCCLRTRVMRARARPPSTPWQSIRRPPKHMRGSRRLPRATTMTCRWRHSTSCMASGLSPRTSR